MGLRTLSIILLIIGWFLLEAPVGICITLWRLDVLATEYQSAVLFTLACFCFGSLLIWVAARLRSRWRTALGFTALVMGLGMLLEGQRIFKDGDVIADPKYRIAFATGVVTSGSLGVLAGMALIIRQRFLDRKPQPKGGGHNTTLQPPIRA